MKLISNKTLFNIHGWLGLNLGLFLFVVCFSGTFATLSGEVDWLLNEDLRIEKKDSPIRWEAMHNAIQIAYPEGTILGIYKNTYAGHSDHFATVAYVGLPNGQNRKVYLDPYEGEIQGDTGFFNVQRFFRTYHRRFFDGERGIFLVTLSSVFLLFSALTGFLFYKGWLKNIFKLRIKKGVKALFSDAHKLAGIWSLIFTLLIALTGVFYFAEVILQSSDNYDAFLPEGPPEIETSERAQFGPAPELLSLDKYVANAEKAYPELEVLAVRIPHNTGGYVYVDGQAGNPITRNRANKVYLHPFTGEVVHIQRSSDLNTAEFITDIADPLHFGYFGGLPTKILWFIFGLILSFAILSGTYLWYVRRMEKMERKLRRKRSREDNSPKEEDRKRLTPAGVLLPFFTSSRGAVLSTIIILYYFLSTGIITINEGLRSYGPLPEERITHIQEVRFGPWSADLKCEYPCTFEENTFSLQFHGKGVPNYDSLSLEIKMPEKIATIPFGGSARNPSLIQGKEIGNSTIEKIRLIATGYDGKRFVAPVTIENYRQAKTLLSTRFDQYPERVYPDVPAGVYLFILFFAICTMTVLFCWTRFLVKATSRTLAVEARF